jgi:TetR/AcrR family transcriptional regulator
MRAPQPRTRPRPRLAGGARPASGERRTQILREAARCFGTRGFRGTTTRDIANAVGITEAALYRHFSGKEAIYAAILDARMAAPEVMEAVEPAARAKDDDKVFSTLAMAVLNSVEADPSFLRLLLYSALENHEMARPFYETRVRRLREFLTKYIGQRQRDGEFRDVDPVLAARAFVGMVADHMIARTVFGQKDLASHSTERIAETFTSIFLDGMRAGKPRKRGVTRG